MKQLWNSFAIAFSMYSKIPMPKSEWNKENMRYVMCFFPAVGVVIGALTYLWGMFGGFFVHTDIFYRIILLLIPVVVTGGIHLDGLLDTSDALSSYQSRERKLEILKDSHAGAFAIIVCVVYFLFYFGITCDVTYRSLPVICIGFILSRSLSALSIASFPMAKNTGLAATFSDGAQKKIVRIVTVCLSLLCFGAMCAVNLLLGLSGGFAAWLTFAAYYRMSKKQFGGITGDLAGFFLQMCELMMALFIVIADNLMR